MIQIKRQLTFVVIKSDMFKNMFLIIIYIIYCFNENNLYFCAQIQIIIQVLKFNRKKWAQKFVLLSAIHIFVVLQVDELNHLARASG